ncbi:bifunctional phosphopantothenoylcysteine decarboxylase/phosphopantothenate--cysteine ligase CoaBC [Amaricoccus tamworthensis]|uniref:bifunctional phosphopantothenoylcysteine decarboxylase/phosphopantothenate--cysteine ligase CoaBC n=1 Tax=Amaricoccus tamworthensis TaxID=57002 RepID=UPI003C7BDC25
MIAGKAVLLVIGGGISAYKSLELIRLLQKASVHVVPVLTRAGSEFVTPLTVSALAGNKLYSELFDLTAESEMGHIELSRSADLVVVAPATADLMARQVHGLANDLASTLLLATDKRVLMAPAMNVRMWEHPATQRNIDILRKDGVLMVGPNEGDMACGEYGLGRMAEPDEIFAAIEAALSDGPLKGKRIVVTSGPTHEPIDPVRYLANRSSGRQGTAIADALVAQGAEVVFVTGPATAPRPEGAKIVEVETALQMRDAVLDALPADAAVFSAAVADWRMAEESGSKLKKDGSGEPPALKMVENPDILKTVSKLDVDRPRLVIGFAAETDDVIGNATAKRLRKGCDWLVANDVSPGTGIMGGTENSAIFVTDDGAEQWPRMSKRNTADALVDRIVEALA